MIPPRVILAPVDFSEPSRTALATAGRLARHTGATLVTVYAENPLLAEAAKQANIDMPSDTARELEQFIASTPSAAALSPRRHVGTGAPVDVIVEASRELNADLVVVGSHGMSGAARFVFGSTTEGVLRKAPVSVLMTPAAWTPAQPTASDMAGTGPIVAAVDFSAESLAAAKAACRLAAALKTEVVLVHVVAGLVARDKWQPHAEAVVRDRASEARTQLDSLAQTLASPVPVATRVETGDVATELAAVAAPGTTTHPLLILGRKAPGQRDGAPGAIAYRVLMLAQVPVLVHVEHA
jgi:nucleotide-binding universal stress UspA family protein